MSDKPTDFTSADSPHFAVPEETDSSQQHPAWEEVGAGRYMPRRVRGSCQGRALG